MEKEIENLTELISKEDYLEFSKQFFIKKQKMIRVFYLIGGIFFVGCGIIKLTQLNFLLAIMFFVVGGFYLYYFKFFYKASFGRAYNRFQQNSQKQYKWLFYESQAIRKSEVGEIIIKYDEISDYIETKNCFILLCNKNWFWFDKNGFKKGSLEDVLELLKLNTKN